MGVSIDWEPVPSKIRFCRSADGVRLAFNTGGTGPLLLQTPTWLTHLELDWQAMAWCDWLTELSAGHTVVRYDLRGCGLSDRHPREQSMSSWVADVEAVADAAGLERFPLFGLCQGAAIAAAFAAEHPERVSRLVLYGSYVQGGLAQPPETSRTDEIQALATLIERGWGSEAPAFREVFSCMLMPDASAQKLRSLTDLETRSTTPAMARRLWLAFHRVDISDLVPRIQVPTLVLHCQGDGMVPFEEGRRMATLIPGAEFVALEGRNHILQAEDPGWSRFWSAVRAFLAEDEAAAEAPSSAPREEFAELTPREREILEWIARGRSNGEISEELCISAKTVRNHVSNIFSKLGVAHRSEAIVLAREAGFGRGGPGLPSQAPA